MTVSTQQSQETASDATGNHQQPSTNIEALRHELLKAYRDHLINLGTEHGVKAFGETESEIFETVKDAIESTIDGPSITKEKIIDKVIELNPAL